MPAALACGAVQQTSGVVRGVVAVVRCSITTGTSVALGVGSPSRVTKARQLAIAQASAVPASPSSSRTTRHVRSWGTPRRGETRVRGRPTTGRELSSGLFWRCSVVLLKRIPVRGGRSGEAGHPEGPRERLSLTPKGGVSARTTEQRQNSPRPPRRPERPPICSVVLRTHEGARAYGAGCVGACRRCAEQQNGRTRGSFSGRRVPSWPAFTTGGWPTGGRKRLDGRSRYAYTRGCGGPERLWRRTASRGRSSGA